VTRVVDWSVIVAIVVNETGPGRPVVVLGADVDCLESVVVIHEGASNVPVFDDIAALPDMTLIRAELAFCWLVPGSGGSHSSADVGWLHQKDFRLVIDGMSAVSTSDGQRI
jgi:hypothetical protein